VNRTLLLVVVLLTGCVPGVAVDDAAITADLACEAARSAVLLSHQITPAPTPPAPPKPTPGKCPRCSGTGLLPTDGRIRIECPDCKGTGKTCADGRCP
jgi:hypothetical protein